ncbi:SGNH/GDSL hydrolase family protein [Nocardia sp. NBC_01327]|uniref:SGNH/GDSL hydrolase family protein n=1 Tax=Nocardia sp. NBC_01327 TaxID=2903593 RepID=UPI002E11D9A5|nr:SGNH/GDSL hydrolase family protein [Nocardia sp. NBC_01327]
MNAELIEKLVRFQQPEKALPYVNGLDDARIAGLFGLDLLQYRDLRAGFADQARRAAEALLEDAQFAAQVDRLPFELGQHVLALGESSTADRLSWFEILRELLAVRRPGDAVKLTNAAVTGCSTTQALTMLPALGFQRPDWVLCQLGANDAQRLGSARTRLVSAAETARNLLLLRDRALELTSAQWVWLTPTAVDEGRAAAFPHFQRAGISWATADMADTARIMYAQPEPAADALSVTMPSSGVGLHLDDGVHLTLAGQQAVTVEVVRKLAHLDTRGGSDRGM